MNEEICSIPMYKNMRVPKYLGSGTTEFNQVEISVNGLHSCFYLILNFQKVSKQPYED